MRSIFLAFVLAACTSSQSPPPPPPIPLPVNPSTAIGLTVVLRCGGAVCGAVAIGPRLLATAAHCVPFATAAFATKNDPTNWHAATVVAQNSHGDAAILFTSEDLQQWATMAPVHRGASVYSVHHGSGKLWGLEEGRVDFEPRIAGADWLETSVFIAPGASGGGLWDSSDRLTGIASWFAKSKYYFVPIREFDSLMDR